VANRHRATGLLPARAAATAALRSTPAAVLPSLIALLGAIGAAHAWGVRIAVLVGALAAVGIALGSARRTRTRAALLVLLAPLPALALWARARAAAPPDVEARALALEQAGDEAWIAARSPATAAQRYGEAAAQCPSYLPLLKLARAQLAIGQTRAASEAVRRAIGMADAPVASQPTAQAAAWLEAGRPELAGAALDAALYAALAPDGLR